MKKLFLLSAVLVACGGSGVSDSKKLSEVTPEEAKDVCLELADDYPEKTVNCTSGGQTFTLTIGFTAAECNADNEPAPSTCTATVGDVRNCADALYSQSDDQICMADSLPAACAKLEGC